jgi:DNA-binding NarL/FixJ family response regulator
MISPSARADASLSLMPQSPHPAAWAPRRSTVTPLRVADAAEPAAGDERPVGRAREIRAIIADGQRLVRAGLRRLFEEQRDISVTGEAANGDQLMALVHSVHPDVVVIDAGLPGVDGFEVTRRILAESPSRAVGVVLLVAGDDDEVVLAALEAGAGGVLAKESEAPEFLRAVRVVARGGATLGPELTPQLIAWLLGHTAFRGDAPAELAELTPRERQVMALVAAGLSNDEIAERLVVTPATAKTHVSRARRKVGARDRAQLVVYAYRNGLVAAPRAGADDDEAGVVRRPRARWTTPATHEERRTA